MGLIKQLLPLSDGPVINYCLRNIIASGIKDIVVVLGKNSPELLDALRGFPVWLQSTILLRVKWRIQSEQDWVIFRLHPQV